MNLCAISHNNADPVKVKFSDISHNNADLRNMNLCAISHNNADPVKVNSCVISAIIMLIWENMKVNICGISHNNADQVFLIYASKYFPVTKKYFALQGHPDIYDDIQGDILHNDQPQWPLVFDYQGCLCLKLGRVTVSILIIRHYWCLAVISEEGK